MYLIVSIFVEAKSAICHTVPFNSKHFRQRLHFQTTQHMAPFVPNKMMYMHIAPNETLILSFVYKEYSHDNFCDERYHAKECKNQNISFLAKMLVSTFYL